MTGGLDASACPPHRVRANQEIRVVHHADRETGGQKCDGVNAWSIMVDACAMHRMTHPGRRIASVSNRDSVFPHAARCPPKVLHSRPNKRQPRSVELQQQQQLSAGVFDLCF